MQTKQVTAYVADEGFTMRTWFAKDYFTKGDQIPVDARLYVRRVNEVDFYQVTGLSRERLTSDIYAETVNFERIDLAPHDFLYVETKNNEQLFRDD